MSTHPESYFPSHRSTFVCDKLSSQYSNWYFHLECVAFGETAVIVAFAVTAVVVWFVAAAGLLEPPEPSLYEH